MGLKQSKAKVSWCSCSCIRNDDSERSRPYLYSKKQSWASYTDIDDGSSCCSESCLHPGIFPASANMPTQSGQTSRRGNHVTCLASRNFTAVADQSLFPQLFDSRSIGTRKSSEAERYNTASDAIKRARRKSYIRAMVATASEADSRSDCSFPDELANAIGLLGHRNCDSRNTVANCEAGSLGFYYDSSESLFEKPTRFLVRSNSVPPDLEKRFSMALSDINDQNLETAQCAFCGKNNERPAKQKRNSFQPSTPYMQCNVGDDYVWRNEHKHNSFNKGYCDQFIYDDETADPQNCLTTGEVKDFKTEALTQLIRNLFTDKHAHDSCRNHGFQSSFAEVTSV